MMLLWYTAKSQTNPKARTPPRGVRKRTAHAAMNMAG